VLAIRRLTPLVIVVSALTGSACGSDGEPAAVPPVPARTIDVVATEYAFNGDPGTITAGDTVEFVVQNAGRLDHSLEVLSAEGRSLGRTDRIAAGESAGVVVTFGTAGSYRLICDVDDHLSRGQSATIIVQPS
jgi:plastocyanin